MSYLEKKTELISIIDTLGITIKEENGDALFNTLALKELVQIPNITSKIETLSYDDKKLFLDAVIGSNGDDNIFEECIGFFAPYQDILKEMLSE